MNPSASVFMLRVILNGPIWRMTSEITTFVRVGDAGVDDACAKILEEYNEFMKE